MKVKGPEYGRVLNRKGSPKRQGVQGCLFGNFFDNEINFYSDFKLVKSELILLCLKE